jgi:hypothetical protein
MTDGPNRLERRAAQRFEVHVPVAICFEERMLTGFTQDLSGRGIFFYSEAAIPVSAVVEFTFTMPSEITLGDSMPVRCRGRILRAESPQGGQHNGIAAQLDSYEYLPADDREPTAKFIRVSAASAAASARYLPH